MSIDETVAALRRSLAGKEADTSSLGVPADVLDDILFAYQTMRASQAAGRVAGLREALVIVKEDGAHGRGTSHSAERISYAIDSYDLDGLYAKATQLREEANALWARGDRAGSHRLHEQARGLQARIANGLPHEAARVKVG